MDSSRQIEDQAAVWLQRRDGDDWTALEEAALQNWLSASIAHRVAFLRLEAAWEESQRLQALGAGAAPAAIPPPGEWHVSPLFERRLPTNVSEPASSAGPPPVAFPQPAPEPIATSSTQRVLPWATAATVLIALMAAWFVNTLSGQQRYSTPTGGLASIPLTDGSEITLNTATEVRVKFSEQERRVRLLQGEVFFEVVADPTRPFIVEAGAKRITVLGTQFSVRRDGEEVRVAVTDGKVRIDGDAAHPQPAAGTIARVSRTHVQVQQQVPKEVDQALSWRTGYLSFETTTLADAIAELNRYTSRKIIIKDPGVAGLHISGKFRANNAEAFIRVLHDGFGIEAQSADDRIVLSAAR